jgi:histone H3/H4
MPRHPATQAPGQGATVLPSFAPLVGRALRRVAPLFAALLALALLGSCASDRLDPGPSAASTREHGLPAREAATLIAELAARELDQFRRDHVTPLCRAERDGEGRYRIYYQSGDGGGFEPYADVELQRQRFLVAGAEPLLQPLQSSPLGHIAVRPLSRRLAPGNGSRFRIDCLVTALGPQRCRVELYCRGSVLGTAADRIERWTEQLEFLESVRGCFDELHVGQRQSVRERLQQTLRVHDLMRGRIAIDLQAISYGLLARIEAEDRNWRDAQRACNHALILAPDAAELHRLRSQIAGKLGDRAELALSNWRTQAYAAPGRGSMPPHRPNWAEDWRAACLDQANQALDERDWVSARAWTERALDEDPGDAQAVLLRSRCARYEGKLREARDLLLSSLQRNKSSEELVLALVDLEQEMGSNEIAYRVLAHFAAEHPALMRSQQAMRLTRSLPSLKIARILRSEGLHEGALQWLARWQESELDEAYASLARYFAPTNERAQENALAGEPWHPDLAPGVAPDLGPASVPAGPGR